MENVTFQYSGANGATLTVWWKAPGNNLALSHTFSNLVTGQVISVDGFDLMGNSGKPPRLKAQTFLSLDNGATTWNVHTSCSEYILGNVYGPFTVISFTDGQSRTCGGVQCVDTDGDGCCDDVDAFPNDPNLCDATYIPGENTYASFAYEDLWPTYGDFDFNDMVINRNTVLYLDINGDVVEADHSFELAAAGAGQKNGFGFRMPGISPTDVSMVTSTYANTQDYTTIASNGLEAGQSEAVVIVFENWKNVITITQNGQFYNTHPDEGLGYSDSIVVHVKFATPQPVASVLEIDPFLIKDGATRMNRDIEIHLPWYGPTDLVDDTYFRTRNDWSSYPGVGNNYVDSGNIPWAIETAAGAFKWPLERVDIRDAYSQFATWASTGNPATWYSDPALRDDAKLF
jgi:LruC domain-containing protein